uniref:Uncharacterized protein n=1 Tax=Zea mays TaxID=4577 RepID=A0A804UCV0_MAIZE
MASKDVVGKSRGDTAVTTIVNLAEEAKLAREGVKAPGHQILTICKSLIAGGLAGRVNTPVLIDAQSSDGSACKKLESSTTALFAGVHNLHGARFCHLPLRCINDRGFCLSLTLRRLPPPHPSTSPLPQPWIHRTPRPGAAVPRHRRPGSTSCSSPHHYAAHLHRAPVPVSGGGCGAHAGGSEVRERDPHGVPVPIRARDAHDRCSGSLESRPRIPIRTRRMTSIPRPAADATDTRVDASTSAASSRSRRASAGSEVRERDPHSGKEARGGSKVWEGDPHGVPVLVPIRARDAHGRGSGSLESCPRIPIRTRRMTSIPRPATDVVDARVDASTSAASSRSCRASAGREVRERDPHGGSEARGGSEVWEQDPHGVPDDLDLAPSRSRRPRRRIDLRGELQIPSGFGREEAAPGSAEPDTRRGGARGDATRRNDDVERGQAPANADRNGNGALADTDVRKKAEDVEAKRKAEEAEAEARRKKEDEEWDADLAAYYQEQWATEDEGATGAAAATAETAPLAAV